MSYKEDLSKNSATDKMTMAMLVLEECISVQRNKSNDYQNGRSGVTQAMHYRRGIDSIHDIIQSKVLRAQSLIEAGGDPNYESIEDSYKDLINYAAFAVAWLRGALPGQSTDRDMFNRPSVSTARPDRIVSVDLPSTAEPYGLDVVKNTGAGGAIPGRWI